MVDVIFTIGIFASYFYAILLLGKKNKAIPDHILGFWMLITGIHLTSYYLYASGYWEIYPHLIGITAPFPLFYGPLLYLYLYYSVHNFGFRKKDYLHFLPVVLSYLYMFEYLFFYTAEEKTMVDSGEIDLFDTFSNVLLVSLVVSALGYTLYGYRFLNKYKILIQENFSNTEHKSLNWLKGFIWGMGLIFLTVTIVLVTRDMLGVTFPFNPDLIFYSMAIYAIISLGYYGIKQQNIFTENIIEIREERSGTSYRNSGLKEGYAEEKHLALTSLMEKEKPYLESDLTLGSLADLLDISPHHLSQIINQFEKQNFNDFVNKYRVDEFIELAKKNPHFSFLALALDSGFNSKSTFNTVFKKHKGITPSQYMKS